MHILFIAQALKIVFGKNASKVESIFEGWTGYAQLFEAVNNEWVEDTTAYKHERAKGIYR